MKEIWNQRYAEEGFVYGEQPNEWLKEQLKGLLPGTILFSAEGEGRNAVYAAQKGWDVMAFDQSESGREKALLFAREKNTRLQYDVCDILETDYPSESFDAIAWIYCHLPEEIRNQAARHIVSFLKPGGMLIFEAFAKEHIARNTSGPKLEEMLYNEEMIRNDFSGFDFQILRKEEVILDEGPLHQGDSTVWRVLAVKH